MGILGIENNGYRNENTMAPMVLCNLECADIYSFLHMRKLKYTA